MCMEDFRLGRDTTYQYVTSQIGNKQSVSLPYDSRRIAIVASCDGATNILVRSGPEVATVSSLTPQNPNVVFKSPHEYPIVSNYIELFNDTATASYVTLYGVYYNGDFNVPARRNP